jgi:hypothetical protein
MYAPWIEPRMLRRKKEAHCLEPIQVLQQAKVYLNKVQKTLWVQGNKRR